MDRAIRVTAGAVSAEARLNDSKTAGAIWDALPIEAKGQTWGDEIYFDIGVTAPPEQARDVVDVGDLAYWPPGQAFCIFFGRTPASRGDERRAARPGNVVGKGGGDARAVAKGGPGSRGTIERQ